MKALVDANGLMAPAQQGVDVLEELAALGYNEPVVPSAVLDELNALKTKVKGADRAALAVALELARRCEAVEAPGPADDALLRLARELNAPVLTNDAALRRRLKAAGLKAIFVRGRQKLAIE